MSNHERTFGRRVFGWLLRLYPTAYREDWQAGMEEVFERRIEDVRARGRMAVLWQCTREYAGLIRNAAVERSRARAGGHEAGGSLANDLRHAARRLARSPGFTVAAVLTLSIAIASNTALFTLVRSVVLEPLPYPDSDRLVALDHSASGLGFEKGIGVSQAMFVHYARGVRVLEGVAAWQSQGLGVRAAGEAREVRTTRATPSLARVLGVRPRLGRWFTEAEGDAGGAAVVVLGYAFWQRELGGDPAVAGSVLVIDGTPHEVIGVMPRSFAFPDERTELWVPARIDAADPRVGGLNYEAIGRLGPGATVSGARAELNTLLSTFPQAYPGSVSASELVNTARLASVAVPEKDYVLGGIARTLFILLGAAVVVFLTACANVANLFLVRAESRQREVAVRRALGASGRAVARFFLSESMLLAAAATMLGLVLAQGTVMLLVRFGPSSIPRLAEVRLDGTVFAFASLLGAAVTLLFGSLRSPRQRSGLAGILHEGGRGATAGRLRFRARRFLMGTQAAFTVLLLIAAILLVRSFVNLRGVDPGFDTRDALVFDVPLPGRDYPSSSLDERDQAAQAQRDILGRIAALPGVTSAAATTCLPLAGICWGDPILVEGMVKQPGVSPPVVGMRRVTGDYFSAIGMRLVGGRFLADGDRTTRSVVINRALADAYFEGVDPVGRRLYPDFGAEDPEWYTVVGVVENAATYSLRASRMPELFLPLVDHTEIGPSITRLSYVVRSAADPLSLAGSVQRRVQAFDANLALARTRTLRSIVSASTAQTAFVTLLLGLAAAVSLVLGLVGIYGVTAYVVNRRAREIGLRIALGATPSSVAGRVVLGGSLVAGAGILAGLAAAFALSAAMDALLFGVGARDGITFVAAPLALFVVAAFACWIPARRFARADPLQSLRTD